MKQGIKMNNVKRKITVKGFQNVYDIFRAMLKMYLHPKLFISRILKFILHMLKRDLDKTINKGVF